MAVLVCVTGAGGFIGSWIVKLLLARGYAVRGTSRSAADDPKNAHLWALDGAGERLAMVRVDLLDRPGLRAAFSGCDGVIHLAAPIVGDPAEIVEAVVTGTRNVVEAAADAGVRRLVLSSTISAMYMDPRRDPEAPLDESSWSDLDYCKNTENWYSYAKTVAEKSAWDAARARGLDMAVVIPVIVLGALLQPGLNVSSTHITKYLNGEVATYAIQTSVSEAVKIVNTLNLSTNLHKMILVKEIPLLMTVIRALKSSCKKTKQHASDMHLGGVKFRSRKRVYAEQPPTRATRRMTSIAQADASLTRSNISVPSPSQANVTQAGELVGNYDGHTQNAKEGDGTTLLDGGDTNRLMTNEDGFAHHDDNNIMADGAYGITNPGGHNQMTNEGGEVRCNRGVNMGHGL